MTATAKVQIEVEARTAKAVGEVGKFTAATAKAKAASEALKDSQSRQSGAMDRATAAMERAGAPLQKMQALMGAGGLVAAATGAAIAVDRLSARALALSDVNRNLTISLEAAKAASGGLISEFELAKNATTALRFGVVQTSADYARHVEIATKLARTIGGDSTKAVEDFTTALARQSPMILDNLGLQVDVEKANADYAKALGKTAAALTEAEKKQAFINAAMVDAEAKVKNLTVATDGWAASVQQAKVKAEDLLDKILQLPENLRDLNSEVSKGSVFAGKYGEALAISARVGLAGVTLGGSEAYIAVSRLHEQWSNPSLLDLYAVSMKGIANANRDVAASAIEAANKVAVQHRVMGLTMSANAELGKALEAEADQVYFDKLRWEGLNPDGTPKKAGGGGGRKKGPAFDALSMENSRASFSRDGSDTREFQGALDEANKAEVAGQIQRVGEIEKEEMAKREEARLKALEEAKDAAAEAAEQRHKEELKRLAEQEARYERVGQKIGDTVGGLATTWLQAGDLSAQGFAKALAAWGKAESIKLAGIAISEGVMALVSLATYNFPGAAAHGAAAAAAGAGAAAIAGLTAAVGGFGSIGKSVGSENNKPLGGSAFGPGIEEAANDRPTPKNSQTDTTPMSPGEGGMAQTGIAQSLGGSGKGGQVIQIGAGAITMLGAIDETAAMKIAQGLKKHGRGSKLTG